MASVYQRANGRWAIRYKDERGKWKSRVTTARTKGDANKLAFEADQRCERARLGLAPALSISSTTLAELAKWWLEERSIHLRSHKTNETTLRKHLLGSAIGAKPAHDVTSGDIATWMASKQGTLSNKTINNLRSYLHSIYEAARETDRVAIANPVTRVKRLRLPKGVHDFLRPPEAAAVLSALPDRWRPLFATAMYQGLRKGELIGLLKSDVDLEARLLTVARSYDYDTTKGGHSDVIPIHKDCVGYLETAMASSTTELVFPRRDGKMFSKNTKVDDVLRRALCRARIVIAYEHRCRRAGCKHTERCTDDAQRRCPKCEMKLWPVSVPRKIRFHDLRHTMASLLTMAGTSMAAVQKQMRHTDPKTTMNTYSHLTPGYLREEIDRLHIPAGAGGETKARVTTLLPPKPSPKRARRDTAKTASKATSNQRARYDSNVRPSGSKPDALSN